MVKSILPKPGEMENDEVNPEIGSAIDSQSTKTVRKEAVIQDIKKFTAFAGRYFLVFASILRPIILRGCKEVSARLARLGGFVDIAFLKRLSRVFVIILLLLIVIYFGIAALGLLKGKGKKGLISEPTPTVPAAYQPYKPSVWAEDPEVLKLEEDIEVLEKELGGSNIRETTLNSPTLDFDISF